jgi:hypothetical protein
MDRIWVNKHILLLIFIRGPRHVARWQFRRFPPIARRRIRSSQERIPQNSGKGPECHNAAHDTTHDRRGPGLRRPRRPRRLGGCWGIGWGDNSHDERLDLVVFPAEAGALVVRILYKLCNRLRRGIFAGGVVVCPLFSILFSTSLSPRL